MSRIIKINLKASYLKSINMTKRELTRLYKPMLPQNKIFVVALFIYSVKPVFYVIVGTGPIT